MATFAELRERLSLDGKQFERVCKWFLETDPRYSDRLVNVWLWDDWPGRWGPDCGIDLVAEDRDGKNWAIQAKCYDPKYSVTKSDVDKFLSESTNENIHHRLLSPTNNVQVRRCFLKAPSGLLLRWGPEWGPERFG